MKRPNAISPFWRQSRSFQISVSDSSYEQLFCFTTVIATTFLSFKITVFCIKKPKSYINMSEELSIKSP